MQEFLDIFKFAYADGINDEILLPLIQETFIEITNGDITEDAISQLILVLIEPTRTIFINSELEQKKIFNETIQPYEKYISTDDRLLRNHLYLLTNHDKVLKTGEESCFYLLKSILDSIVGHKEAIKLYLEAKKSDSMVQRGVAVSSSSKIEKIVNKRKNSLEEITKLIPHDKTVKNSLNVINEFIENPRATNIALNQTIALFSPEELPGLTKDQYETVKSMGNYLNSDGQIKDIDVFHESLAASIASCYGKESDFSKKMHLDTISHEKLSEITTVIIQSIFDTDYSIKSSKISQPIQLRCMHGNDLPLLEFQTPSNIKIHPIFEENEETKQFFSELSRILRGKLPPKSSV